MQGEGVGKAKQAKCVLPFRSVFTCAMDVPYLSVCVSVCVVGWYSPGRIFLVLEHLRSVRGGIL